MRNTGSTVLYLSWSRVPRGETVVSVNGAVAAGGSGSDGEGGGDQDHVVGETAAKARGLSGGVVSVGGGIAGAAAKHAALQSPDDRFFCVQVNPPGPKTKI